MSASFDPSIAALYGQFVQAAYTMYNNDQGSLTPKPSDDFPGGYELVAWISMQDFILESTEPVFYGYVAQNSSAPGKFVIALRGTSNGIEMFDDLTSVFKTPFKVPGCGYVAQGFARIYDTLQLVEPSISGAPSKAAAPRANAAAGSFSQQVAAVTRRRSLGSSAVAAPARALSFSSATSIEVVGHSLGAALATLYTMENAYSEKVPILSQCTFASPLVGDAVFADAFNRLQLTSWRVANVQDVVTVVPPAILGFQHVNDVVPVSSAGRVLPTVVCRHALSTYLSLIDAQKQPDPDCRLVAGALAARPSTRAALAAPPKAPQPFRPVAIDLYQGDNVQDSPGPLGGFARVKAKGIAFLFHKATEGVSVVDSRYRARRAAWMSGDPITVVDVDGKTLRLQPRFAAYHFFVGDDPEAEAQHFLSNAQLQRGDDAVVDWEQTAGGAQPSADAVDAFCNIVERALGFPIIVYSGNVAKEQLKGKDARFAKRRLWLAQYSRAFTVPETWDFPWMWQNNGDSFGVGPNSIDGIDGNCDNSTIAAPMTIARLYNEWGGGQATKPLEVVALTKPAAVVLPKRKIARYGWKPELPDQRDLSYVVPQGVTQTMGSRVDLRSQCPAIYDQGQIGSCTANAIAAAIEFDMLKQAVKAFTPSRLFIYFNERSIEGTVGSDAGAFIRDGIKSVASLGDCPETDWPYDDTPADPATGVFPTGARAAIRPPQSCFDDAVKHKAVTYMSVDQNLADMKGCLSSGSPFVFGFTVYPSFESDDVARSGVVPMPGANEATIGGHAVLAVGYDDETTRFIIRNSWGPNWGENGYCYMPYAYLLDNNLSDDFWTIRIVS